MFTVVSVQQQHFDLKVENDYDYDDKLTLKLSGTNDGESSWPTNLVPLHLLMNSAADKRLFGSLLIICSTNS